MNILIFKGDFDNIKIVIKLVIKLFDYFLRIGVDRINDRAENKPQLQHLQFVDGLDGKGFICFEGDMC